MTQTIWECFRPAFRERTWVYIYYTFVYISSVLKIILSFYVVVFDCFSCFEDMSPICLKLKFLLIPLYIFCYLIFHDFLFFSHPSCSLVGCVFYDTFPTFLVYFYKLSIFTSCLEVYMCIAEVGVYLI